MYPHLYIGDAVSRAPCVAMLLYSGFDSIPINMNNNLRNCAQCVKQHTIVRLSTARAPRLSVQNFLTSKPIIYINIGRLKFIQHRVAIICLISIDRLFLFSENWAQKPYSNGHFDFGRINLHNSKFGRNELCKQRRLKTRVFFRSLSSLLVNDAEAKWLGCFCEERVDFALFLLSLSLLVY